MVAIKSSFQCLTYALLVLPPMLLTTYLLASFPHPPKSLHIHPSLASLPRDCKSWEIYPENFYPGGDYVSLPFGRVRYWIFGPEDGKRIVLVHGLSVPAFIWQFVAPDLAKRGYRVMLYDLYGRGYSDSPDTTYNSLLYTTQLALLMQHIKWDKAHIVGVSMGGAITAAFTANFPELVEDRVIVIACAGLIQSSDLPRTAKVMSQPAILALSSTYIAQKFIRYRTNSHDVNSPVNPIQEIVRIQSAHLPGYNAAISSSLRDGPIRGLASSFQSDVWRGRRLLIIHGTADNTVPYRYASKIQSLLPVATTNATNTNTNSGKNAITDSKSENPITHEQKGCYSKVVTIEGGRHDLTISHSEEMIELIDKWIKAS